MLLIHYKLKFKDTALSIFASPVTISLSLSLYPHGQAREQSECAQLLMLALMYSTSPSPLCVQTVALEFLASLLEAVAEHPLPVSPLPHKKTLYDSSAALMVGLLLVWACSGALVLLCFLEEEWNVS